MPRAPSAAKRVRRQGLAAAATCANDEEEEELMEDPLNRSVMAVVGVCSNTPFAPTTCALTLVLFLIREQQVRGGHRGHLHGRLHDRGARSPLHANRAAHRSPTERRLLSQISQFCDDQAYSKTISMIARHEPHQLFFTVAMKVPGCHAALCPSALRRHTDRPCVRALARAGQRARVHRQERVQLLADRPSPAQTLGRAARARPPAPLRARRGRPREGRRREGTPTNNLSLYTHALLTTVLPARAELKNIKRDTRVNTSMKN